MKLFPASAAIAVIGFFSASAAPTSPPQLYPSQSLSNSQSVSNSRDEEPREGKGSRMGKGYSSVPSSRPTRYVIGFVKFPDHCRVPGVSSPSDIPLSSKV